MKFFKYQALSNDFVIVEDYDSKKDFSTLAKKLCNRKRGVGADGLIVYGSDCNSMEIFNHDGSRAAMCGNGIRCLALHIWRKTGKFPCEISTESGVIKLKNQSLNPFCCAVDLGIPIFFELKLDAKKTIGEDIEAIGVNTGTSHIVLLDCGLNLGKKVWAKLKADYNIDCVKAKTQNEIEIVTFERGVGKTESCGTGAAAAFAACRLLGLAEDMCVVKSDGGNTDVFEEQGRVWISAGAELVYEGVVSE